MARPIDGVISALADGAPIDWRAVEGAVDASDQDLARQLRAISAIRVGDRTGTKTGRAWAIGAIQATWAALLLLAGLQVFGTVSIASDVLAGTGPAAPSWLLLANVVLFGAFGTLLVFGGQQDRRVRALGALFLIIGAAFAHPLLGRAALSAPSWQILRAFPADAFLACALWLFVWAFPRPASTSVMRAVGIMFLVGSAGLGILLFSANAAIEIGVAGGPLTLPGPFDRNSSTSLYWLLVCGFALPAIPYLVLKSRNEPVEDRRRIGFFMTALVVGLSPMILAVIASIFFPWLGDPSWRPFIGMLLFAALASIVPTSAYAVAVDRVIDLRVVIARSTQRAVARYAVWLASLGPLVYLAVDLYSHRDVTLTEYLGTGGRFSLFLLLFVGFTALTFRYQMLRGVDHWFRRETGDSAESLARLDRSLRQARTVHEVSSILASEINRAVNPSSTSVLVVEQGGGRLVPVAGSAGPLSLNSVLVDLVRGAGAEVRSGLGAVARLLPAEDRNWLTDGGVQLVSPLVGSTGSLLGMVAVGDSQHGLGYSERDHAVVSSMCGHAALQLENQWLRERPLQESTDLSGTVSAAIDWQHEPAQSCPECFRVWPSDCKKCSCGSSVSPAALPLLVRGKFQLERVLGAGGMGVVYLATDVVLGRKVALKTIPRLSDPLAARLQREARAMATVRHPHLALIYGAEQWRGNPVLIVEYLEGGTVLDGLRRGPFELSEALGLGIVLADVLDRLHGSRILHRDIKPSNIGYTSDGVPKLLDLGLTAVFDGVTQEPGAGSTSLEALQGLDSLSGGSHTGQLLGTLRYMAPEALEGSAPQPSFDLWSLSLVLYEVLSGRHPFAEMSADETVGAIKRGAFPDIRDSCPECPAPVAAFLRDALSPVPARRPATASDLRIALQSLRATCLPKNA